MFESKGSPKLIDGAYFTSILLKPAKLPQVKHFQENPLGLAPLLLLELKGDDCYKSKIDSESVWHCQ